MKYFIIIIACILHACLYPMEKEKSYKLTYPPARAFLRIITPINKILTNKEIAHFEKKLYQFDHAYYKKSNETLFDRSYGNENAHKQLLLERDVPTLRFHGALFLDSYKKDKNNKEAFEWASSYLFLGAQEGDPFCQELLGHLLLMQGTSDTATIFHQKQVVPSPAEHYFRMAAQPRTFMNLFTQKYETLSGKGSNITWKVPNSSTLAQAKMIWQFLPAQDPQENISPEPKINPRVLWQSIIKKETVPLEKKQTSITATKKNKPPKPPYKNKKALHHALLQEAHQGKPHAIYAQALFTKTLSVKKEYKDKMLSWIKKLVEAPKAGIFREKGVNLLEKIPDQEKTFSMLSFLCSTYASGEHDIKPCSEKMERYASALITQHKNKKKMTALFKTGLLEQCLPFAQNSSIVSELCCALIEAACDGVYQNTEKIFTQKNIPLAQILELISQDQKLSSKPEIALLKAAIHVQKNQHTSVLPVLITALKNADKKNRLFIKEAVSSYLFFLQEMSIDLCESKQTLEQHKIYGFGINSTDVMAALHKPLERVAQHTALALMKHPTFTKLLESKNEEIQYNLAVWLGTHQSYIKKATSQKNIIMQQLADEKFIPAQIYRFAQESTKLSLNTMPEYFKNLHNVLLNLPLNFFDLYPACHQEVKQCLETIVTCAKHNADAAYTYGLILESGIASLLDKQLETACTYYTKALKLGITGEAQTKALLCIENYIQQLNQTTDLEGYIKKHLFLIHYYHKHNNAQKLIQTLHSLTSVEVEEHAFKTQLMPCLEKINLIDLANTCSLQNNWKNALDCIRFMTKKTLVIAINSTQTEQALYALNTCKDISKLLLKWIFTNEYNVSENDRQKMKNFMGKLCNITGHLQYYKLGEEENAIKTFTTGSSVYNNAKASYSLANIKINSGQLTEGLELLYKSADQNNKDALELLGKLHIDGLPLASATADKFIYNYKQGYSELTKAALLGSEHAKNLLLFLRKPKEICEKPLDIKNTKACYKYGQFLFANGNYEDAAYWFEHVPHKAIVQARFYKGMLKFHEIQNNKENKASLDKACKLLSSVIEHQNEFTENPFTDSKQFIDLSLQGLLFLAFKHNHIPSLLSAANYTTRAEYSSNHLWRKVLPLLTKKIETDCYEKKHEQEIDLFIKKATEVVTLYDDYTLWVALGDLHMHRPHTPNLSHEEVLRSIDKAILFYSSMPLQDKENTLYKHIVIVKAKLCISKIHALIDLHNNNPKKYPFKAAQKLYDEVQQDQKKYHLNLKNELLHIGSLLKELKKKKK